MRHARHNPTRACDRREVFGFTLIELLVVITIMTLLMLILLPAFGAMRRSNRQSGGQNAVLTGVIATRAYATRNLQGAFVDIDGNGNDGRYSGVAMLFAPSGEIRIVENVWNARDGSLPTDALLETKPSPQNGYADILVNGEPRDYIELPRHVGVVGITRGGTSAKLILLPPPFAVRFDENGHLVSRRSDDEIVFDDGIAFYDGIVFYDGEIPLNGIQVSDDRPSDYNPARWSPQSDAFDVSLAGPATRPIAPGDSRTQLVYRLPFDRIETVIGVLVYDAQQFTATESEYVVADGAAPSGDAAWLLENGTPMLFSRYSGTLLR